MSRDTLRQYVWNGCYVIQLVADGGGSAKGGNAGILKERIVKEAVSRYSPQFSPRGCSGTFVLLACMLSDGRDMGIVRKHATRVSALVVQGKGPMATIKSSVFHFHE